MTGVPLIEVEDLRIDLDDGVRRVAAAEGISFRIDRGEIENIIDDGEQRRRGFHHIARVLALFGVERADRRIVENALPGRPLRADITPGR